MSRGSPRRAVDGVVPIAPWPLSAGSRLAVVAVLFAAGGYLLWVVRAVLSPFVVAIVLAYVLRPIVGAVCRRTRWPRALVSALVLFALLVLLAGVLVLLAPAFARELRAFATALPRLMVSLRTAIAAQRTVSLFGVVVDLNVIADEATRALVAAGRELSMRAVSTVVNTVETVLKSVLALVIAFYLLIDFGRFRKAVRAALPPGARQELGALVNDVDRVLGQFLRAEVILVLIMSSVTWVALTILGVRYALVLALLAGVLELVPFIGPVLAGTPAVIIGFLLPSPFGWHPLVNAAVIAATYFVLRHAEDYFVIPQIIGRAVELHPLVAMFAAFAGLRLGGILGMFLGVPLAAVLRILLVYLYRKLIPTPEPAAGLPDSALPGEGSSGEQLLLDGDAETPEPAQRRVPVA
ncbi:MAG TPA: AI-2E family transporter [Chloroflexota bacterium]|nr:AI-2E family transporter [Chloroflexota bacterium]